MKTRLDRLDYHYNKQMSIETYVKSRLKRWAQWCLEKDNPGLDYAKQSLLYRMLREGHVPLKSSGPKPITSNPLAEEIEAILQEMFQESLTLQRCVIALRADYLSRENDRSNRAKSVGMTISQFKIHVDKARVYIAGRLKERYSIR